MVTVTLNVPPVLAGIPGAVAAALPQIAEAVRGEIVAQAQRTLTSSGADYVQGLHVINIPLSPAKLDQEATFATVVLTGWLANAVEQGWSGGDLKPFLLNGRNARMTKDGKRFNVVSFRHGTPGTSGRSFPAMGAVQAAHGMNRSDAEQLGKRVYAQARKLSATTSHPGAGTRWGGRLPEGTGGATPLSNRGTGYQHKTDIFAGMVRQEKAYANRVQSSYRTFRAVSDNSDPGSWVHPGIIRHDFFGRAAQRIPALAALIFDGIAAGMTSAGGV